MSFSRPVGYPAGAEIAYFTGKSSTSADYHQKYLGKNSWGYGGILLTPHSESSLDCPIADVRDRLRGVKCGRTGNLLRCVMVRRQLVLTHRPAPLLRMRLRCKSLSPALLHVYETSDLMHRLARKIGSHVDNI
jgi:hypothetical protein